MTRRQKVIYFISYVVLALAVASAWGFSAYLNSRRLDDLQDNRFTSCEKTYAAFHEVFKPFFPPPSTETIKQTKNRLKFEATIDHLKAGCRAQTAP